MRVGRNNPLILGTRSHQQTESGAHNHAATITAIEDEELSAPRMPFSILSLIPQGYLFQIANFKSQVLWHHSRTSPKSLQKGVNVSSESRKLSPEPHFRSWLNHSAEAFPSQVCDSGCEITNYDHDLMPFFAYWAATLLIPRCHKASKDPPAVYVSKLTVLTSAEAGSVWYSKNGSLKTSQSHGAHSWMRPGCLSDKTSWSSLTLCWNTKILEQLWDKL